MVTPDPPNSAGSAYPNRPSSAAAARRSAGIASVSSISSSRGSTFSRTNRRTASRTSSNVASSMATSPRDPPPRCSHHSFPNETRGPGPGTHDGTPGPGTRSPACVAYLLRPGSGLGLHALPGRVGLPGGLGVRLGRLGPDAGLDLAAEVLVHVAPVLEGALQDRFGHPVEQVADDVGDQPLAGRVVEHLTDHGARLAESVVFGAPVAGRAHEPPD